MDRFTQFTTHPTVRKLAARLAIPITLPLPLRRDWPDPHRLLLGRKIAVSTFSPSFAAEVRSLATLGSHLVCFGNADQVAGSADLARSLGRQVDEVIAEGNDSLPKALRLVQSIDGLLLDTQALGGSHALYTQLQPIISKLAPHARLVLVNQRKAMTPDEEAESDALFGFVKSFAREMGRKAITVNLLEVARDAEASSRAAVASFLLTDEARYITAQRLHLRSGSKNTPATGLSGEHALVTGGARGIGAAIAKALATQGAQITLVDLASARESAAAICAEINESGAKAHFLPCDITNQSELSSLLAIAERHFGPLAMLINNAGITRDKTFAKMTAPQWQQVISVNYEAAKNLTELAFKSKVPPRTIFLSSVSGIAGNFGQTNYSLSKAALVGYVRGLAQSQPEAQVIAVAPGLIDTALTREVPLFNREIGKQLTCLLQAGEPEDIADAVVFLATPAASALSGETVRVDGGMFFGI